ncbi:BspA family leucine-rich repeat surface protein [Enterococcus hirae]
MKRLLSFLLCSSLLLGSISNNSIVYSLAEEEKTNTTSQQEEAETTENQIEQANESSTETKNEEKQTLDQDQSANEMVSDSEKTDNKDVSQTETESSENLTPSIKKKTDKSVLAVTPNQATTEDGQALDIEHTTFELSPDKKSIILTAYSGNKTDLVIPSKIKFKGMDLAVKVKIEQNNAMALFPSNVHSIRFVSIGGTKVELENNTTNGVILDYLFGTRTQYYPNLTSMDFSGLNMDNVVSMYSAFYGGFLPALKTIDFGENTLCNVTNMANVFSGVTSLETIQQRWTFGKLTTMLQMFGMPDPKSTLNPSKLISIGDTSQWNVSTVTNMKEAFLNCIKLKTLDLSTWDVSNVTTMNSMFFNCPALTSIDNTGNWNVSQVTDFSGMFMNCTSLDHIYMNNWHLNPSANLGNSTGIANGMFYLYGRGYDPLPALIIASDDKLLNYPYAEAGYEPSCEIRINTNTGTLPYHLYWDRKDDKNTDLSYYFYQTAIPTTQYEKLSKLSGPQLQEKIKTWLETNVPTKTDYALTGWAPTDQSFEQTIQSINNFDTFINNKAEFKANWVSDNFDTSPDNTKLNPTGSLGIAYYPTIFTINSTNLQSSGEQKIPISKQMSLNFGVKDRTRTTDKWQVTAQLSWNGTQLPNAYIAATNTGTVTQNTSTGLDGYSPTNLTPLSGNGITGTTTYQINGNASPIMKSNGTMVNNGVYDFNLGEAVLVIPDVSQVAAGHYQGQVNWNLTIGPS